MLASKCAHLLLSLMIQQVFSLLNIRIASFLLLAYFSSFRHKNYNNQIVNCISLLQNYLNQTAKSSLKHYQFLQIYLDIIYCSTMQKPQSQTLQQQIQTSYETLKTDIIVSQAELESKQSVRKIIKKYQSRITEMLKLIQKQKKQNEMLKGDFKQLNQQLNSLLKKMQPKSGSEELQKNTDSRVQVLKKELDNEIKKNGILKKEIEQIKYKEKYLEGYKVDDLKNLIKEKDRAIEDLSAKIKLYQKLDKQEKNGDSYKKQEQLTHKIMQQNEQIVHLKKKLQEQKKIQQTFQKTIKTLRQQITSLESKATTKTSDKKQKQSIQNHISKQQFEKLNEKLKQLESSKKMNDKSSKQEIQTLTLKLKNYQREFAELKEEMSKKQQYGNILMMKLKQNQRKNFTTIEPSRTVRYSQQILHNSSIFENRKQFKGLTYGQGIYRQFDDSKALPIEKNFRIKKVVFTHFEEHILSLTTEYQISNNESGKPVKTSKTIDSFAIPSQYSNIKIVQYSFSDYQYISSLEIFTLKAIDLIKITTSKEEIIQIGNTKNIPKYKHHIFDIKNHQKPICFLGVVENKKIGGENREFLISLGLQIRRKQVFIRGKTNKKSQSTHKSSLNNSNNLTKD